MENPEEEAKNGLAPTLPLSNFLLTLLVRKLGSFGALRVPRGLWATKC